MNRRSRRYLNAKVRKIEKRCLRLEELVLRRAIDPSDFIFEFRDISKGLVRNGYRFHGNAKLPLTVFRGRILSVDEPIPKALKECIYPEECKTKLGRANLPGKPVFYGAVNPATVFSEVRCTPGDRVLLCEFRSYSRVNVQLVGNLGEKFGQIENPFENLLRKVFMKKGSEYYEYSARISDFLMSGKDLDGIMYPSIHSNNICPNFALTPRCVDSKMLLINASLNTVNHIPKSGTYNFTEVDFGNATEGHINWKGRKRQWIIQNQGESLTFEPINNMWVARDSRYNIIDPS